MSYQKKSRKAASSWRKTNPINLPSVPARRYLPFQCALMEINPSLTPPGIVNIMSEEWGEARTAEPGEQTCPGAPAFTEMWWNRSKQDAAGLYGLSSSSAGPLFPHGHLGCRTICSAPVSPGGGRFISWAPQEPLQSFFNLHQVPTSSKEGFFSSAGECQSTRNPRNYTDVEK